MAPVLASALAAELAKLASEQGAAAYGGLQALPPFAAAADAATTVASPMSPPSHAIRGQQERSGAPRHTLRSFLQELRNEDPRRVFVARRINQLGFRSRMLLEQHFSRYGEVTQVMVAHSKVKSSRNSLLPRTRPGNLGLVVMRRPEAVQQILAEGTEQAIAGMQVHVHLFDRHKMDQEENQSSSGSGSSSRWGGYASSHSHGGRSAASESTASGSCGEAMLAADWAQPWAPHVFDPEGCVPQCFLPPLMQPQLPLLLPPGLVPGPALPDLGHISAVEESMRAAAALRHLAQQAQQAQQSLKCFEERCTQNLRELSSCQWGSLREQTQKSAATVVAAAMAASPAPSAERTEPAGTYSASGIRFSPAKAPCASPGLASALAAAPLPPPPYPDLMAPQQPEGASQGAAPAATCGAAKKEPAEPGNAPATAEAPAEAAAEPQDGRRGGAQQRDGRDTLVAHLAQLQDEDPASIVVARGIAKLGFRSREILRQHYSQYGTVSLVLIANSKVKPARYPECPSRTRPGGLGLIVMKCPESVNRIMAPGEPQRIAGHEIRVERFHRPKAPADTPAGEAIPKAGVQAGTAGPAGPDDASSSGSSCTGPPGAALTGQWSGSRSGSSGRDADVGSGSSGSEGPGSSP